MRNNFCPMPFIATGTKPDGVARICCYAPTLEMKDGDRYLKYGRDSLKDIWNSEGYLYARNKILNDERMPECENCWREEERGRRSKRLSEIDRWKLDPETLTTYQDNYPIYLDLRLGNLCNLKCRTCNPLFSSMWQKDLDTHENWGDVLENQYRDSFERVKQDKDWFLSDRLWDDMEEIMPNLREVFISGGEPSINPKLIDFLNLCSDNGFSEKIVIRLNTNGTNLNNNFKNALKRFKKVIFSVSVDAVGEKNDFLRPPSTFGAIEKNIRQAIAIKNFEVDINCTVSVYNIAYVHEVFQWRDTLPKKVPITLEMVHQPEMMQIGVLPKQLREFASANVETILNMNLSKREESFVKALLNTLKEDRADLLPNFIEHTEKIDEWHGLKLVDFLEIFDEDSV